MIDKLRNSLEYIIPRLRLVIEISVMYVYERRFLAGMLAGLAIGYVI